MLENVYIQPDNVYQLSDVEIRFKGIRKLMTTMMILGKTRVHYTWLVVIFVTTMSSSSHACDSCSSVWEKVYETDSSGIVMNGSLSDLTAAFRLGTRIRFLLPTGSDGGYAGEFNSLIMWSKSADLYCGQSLMHVGKNDWDAFVDDAFWKLLYICTTGYVFEIDLDVGSSDVVGVNTNYVAVQWFALKPVYDAAVYSHRADGSQVSGSKDDLLNAVMSGQGVSVQHSNRYFLQFQNVEISESGEIAGQHIWNLVTDFVKLGVIFAVPATWHFSIWNTDGFHKAVSWKFGEHEEFNNKVTEIDMRWFVDPCWCEAYAHDQNGVLESGSLQHLLSAVEFGHRVKIMMGNYSIEVDNLRMKRGHVSAQLLNQMSKKDAQTFEDDLLWITQMAHTTGTVQTRTYPVGNATNESVENRAIRWFVDTNSWTNVLSIGADGSVRSGSKAALKSAVLKGASVRVAIQKAGRPGKRSVGVRGAGGDRESRRAGGGWFVLKADNLQLGPSGEVAAQMIKSVSTVREGRHEFRIPDDASWRFMIATTLGDVTTSNWRLGEDVHDGNSTRKANVKWFVSY